MNGHGTSVVLATDHRVADFDMWFARINASLDEFTRAGVRHLVVYRCIEDPNRVFVTLGVRLSGELNAFLRSPALREWLEAAGIDDLPPFFVGKVVEKIDLRETLDDHSAFGIIVASIGRVDRLDRLQSRVHELLDRLRHSVWRFWTYQAVDDPDEVLLFQELSDHRAVQRWLQRRDEWAAYVAGPGVGVYPSVFIGSLVRYLELTGD